MPVFSLFVVGTEEAGDASSLIKSGEKVVGGACFGVGKRGRGVADTFVFGASKGKNKGKL